ncbi:MAG: rod shape-determining protein MreD [Anaerolineae bacterium]
MHSDRRSSWGHVWIGLALLALLAALQGTGRLRFGSARVTPDMVLCAVIAWSFLTDSVHGAVWGFMGGLMLDSISSTPFPLHTIALILVGIVVGSGRLSVYADEGIWALAAAAIGCVVFYGVMWIGLSFQGWSPPALMAIRRVVLPVCLLDVLGVVVILPVLRLVRRRLVGPVLAV